MSQSMFNFEESTYFALKKNPRFNLEKFLETDRVILYAVASCGTTYVKTNKRKLVNILTDMPPHDKQYLIAVYFNNLLPDKLIIQLRSNKIINMTLKDLMSLNTLKYKLPKLLHHIIVTFDWKSVGLPIANEIGYVKGISSHWLFPLIIPGPMSQDFCHVFNSPHKCKRNIVYASKIIHHIYRDIFNSKTPTSIMLKNKFKEYGRNKQCYYLLHIIKNTNFKYETNLYVPEIDEYHTYSNDVKSYKGHNALKCYLLDSNKIVSKSPVYQAINIRKYNNKYVVEKD